MIWLDISVLGDIVELVGEGLQKIAQKINPNTKSDPKSNKNEALSTDEPENSQEKTATQKVDDKLTQDKEADPKAKNSEALSTDKPKNSEESTAKKKTEDEILPIDIATEDGPSPEKGAEKKSDDKLSEKDKARLKRISELDQTLAGANAYDEISPFHTMVNFLLTLAAAAEKLYLIHKLDHPSNKNTDANKENASEEDLTPDTPKPDPLDDMTPTIEEDVTPDTPEPDIELSDNPPVNDLDSEVSKDLTDLHSHEDVSVISHESSTELTAKQINADESNQQQKSEANAVAKPKPEHDEQQQKAPTPSPNG